MPNDFSNKSFQKVFRGYSAEEVDSYIDYINAEYKKLERKYADSERKLVLAQKKIDEYITDSIQESPIATQAREVAAKLLREAEQKRNTILSDSESKAQEIISEAEKQSAEILNTAAAEAEAMLTEAKSEADSFRESTEKEKNAAILIFNEVNSFREKLYALYNSHLETIDSMSEAAHGFMEKLDNGEDVENGIEYGTDSLTSAPEAAEPVEAVESVEPVETFIEEPSSYTAGENTTEYAESVETENYEAEEASDTEQSTPAVQTPPADISFIDRLFTKISESEDIIPEGDDIYVDIPEDASDEDENELIVEESDFNTIEEYEMDDSADSDEIDESYEEDETYEEDEADNLLRLSIDWKSKSVHQNDEVTEYDEYDDSYADENSGEYEDEDVDDDDSYIKEAKSLLTKKKSKKNSDDDLDDIDKLFVSSDSDMSLTDEFNVIFAEADSKKNVSEIRRQPTIVPDDEPKNKKHRKR